MKAAVYARVSTLDQNPDNQLIELRRYVGARGWQLTEYVDHGVSGAKEGRPELNRLLRDAKRRQIDIVICWRLDRLGRSLRHLILLLDELTALGVGFVSSMKASTPAPLPGDCSSMCWVPSRSSNGAGCESA
jgi:DNA invertase Pin-like site-specific DNA recombinase